MFIKVIVKVTVKIFLHLEYAFYGTWQSFYTLSIIGLVQIRLGFAEERSGIFGCALGFFELGALGSLSHTRAVHRSDCVSGRTVGIPQSDREYSKRAQRFNTDRCRCYQQHSRADSQDADHWDRIRPPIRYYLLWPGYKTIIENHDENPNWYVANYWPLISSWILGSIRNQISFWFYNICDKFNLWEKNQQFSMLQCSALS